MAKLQKTKAKQQPVKDKQTVFRVTTGLTAGL